MDEVARMAGSDVEWANQTTVHPLGLLMLAACGLALLAVPRRHAVFPMLALACLVAPAQRIVLLGLDFDFLRILVLCGWIRVLTRAETDAFAWKPLDFVLLVYAATNTLAHTLLMGTSAAFINRLGFSFDAVGMYFLFRCLVRDWDDVRRVALGLILLSFPVAIAFLIESATGRNAFAAFGGVPAVTVVREGRLRCQGPFPHAIMAGCFWAAVLPLIAALWWNSRVRRARVILGVVCVITIVFFTASSTPVMAVIFAVLGGLLFPVRQHLRTIRWCVLLLLLALHFMMKAPVWHLLARVNIVSGSTGWHRYHLVDQAINRVGEWWLLGTETTANWGAGLQDVTNHFVLEGVQGGLITLSLFVAAITLAFQGVGRAWRRMASQSSALAMSWSLGVVLFVHCTSFVAVSYFGQIMVLWYLSLALVGSLTPGGLLHATHVSRRRTCVESRAVSPAITLTPQCRP